MAAGVLAPAVAAPVQLSFSSASAPLQSFFVGDPVIGGQARYDGRSDTWSLESGVAATLELFDLFIATGGADPGCCRAETRGFVADVTLAGVVRQLRWDLRLTEVLNNQYQFDQLAAAPLRFDLGAVGELSLDFRAFSFQTRAGDPLAYGTSPRAQVLLTARPQSVDEAPSLALALLALACLGAGARTGTGARRAAARR